jgi:hypothetical protein
VDAHLHPSPITLAQMCSTSLCEWNWNSYSFVHSKMQNWLISNQAKDMVYIYTNNKLLWKWHGANPIASNESDEDEVKHDPFEFHPDDEIPFSKTCRSNFFMISHALPMQGCLPSNSLNDTKTYSTMCTKLAQVSQNLSLLKLTLTTSTLVNNFWWWLPHNELTKVV